MEEIVKKNYYRMSGPTEGESNVKSSSSNKCGEEENVEENGEDGDAGEEGEDVREVSSPVPGSSSSMAVSLCTTQPRKVVILRSIV